MGAPPSNHLFLCFAFAAFFLISTMVSAARDLPETDLSENEKVTLDHHGSGHHHGGHPGHGDHHGGYHGGHPGHGDHHGGHGPGGGLGQSDENGIGAGQGHLGHEDEHNLPRKSGLGDHHEHGHGHGARPGHGAAGEN